VKRNIYNVNIPNYIYDLFLISIIIIETYTINLYVFIVLDTLPIRVVQMSYVCRCPIHVRHGTCHL